MVTWRSVLSRLVRGPHAVDVRQDLEQLYQRDRAAGRSRLAASMGHVRRVAASAYAVLRGRRIDRAGATNSILATAWRGLWSTPHTSVLAAGILAVGLAASTVTFSVVDAVALRALPLQDPATLVAIGTAEGDGRVRPQQAPQDFLSWQSGVPALEGLAASAPWTPMMTAVPGVQDAAWINGPVPLFGQMATYSIDIEGFGRAQGPDSVGHRAVSPNYFAVSGMRFIKGRPFDALSPG